MPTPEGLIKNEILSWLHSNSIFCWPVDSVGIYDPKRKVFRRRSNIYHINGVSDILGIYKGIPLAIEVKSKTGRLSPEQKIFIEKFNHHGGIAFMARSIGDVMEALSEANFNISRENYK